MGEKNRYSFIFKGNGSTLNKEGTGAEIPIALVKNMKTYYGPADKLNYTNFVNSGNTIEGYDLTLGGNLELNYYMNLLPDVVEDAKAAVQFKIGDEVVATQKVSEAQIVNGLYKFTCPVNSTQMASDIKVSIESETTEYKIYMDGVATDEYTYSVAAYANYILASEDAKYTAAKPVVKAMLNYGAYAQTYFAAKNGGEAGTLANVGYAYTAEELAQANFGTGTVTGATAGMTATLVLDTDTVIKIYKGGEVVAESEGITADKLNDNVTVGDVTVSVLTLAGKVPAGNTNFKNLANALALYSAATEAFEAYINSQK